MGKVLAFSGDVKPHVLAFWTSGHNVRYMSNEFLQRISRFVCCLRYLMRYLTPNKYLLLNNRNSSLLHPSPFFPFPQKRKGIVLDSM